MRPAGLPPLKPNPPHPPHTLTHTHTNTSCSITARHPDLINITINVDALGTPATPMGHVSYLEQAHYK